MRLGVKLLNSDAQLNNFYELTVLYINKGDTTSLVFQLLDLEKKIRYVPAAGATVQVKISRFPEYFPSDTGQRVTTDFTISTNAANPFPLDTSIWAIPLSALQTAHITSSAVQFILTEGAVVRNAVVPMMIQATDPGDLS